MPYNPMLKVHNVVLSPVECGRVRQFIKLIETHEDKAKELMDKLRAAKNVNDLSYLEDEWAVADYRKKFHINCEEEAWLCYVSDFCMYIRNIGVRQICCDYLANAQEKGWVKPIRVPKPKSKLNTVKEEKVPVLSGPERIAKAYEERHADDNKPKEEEVVNQIVPVEEVKEVVEEPIKQQTEIEEDVVVVYRRDLLRVIEHFNLPKSNVPHKSIYNLMYAMITQDKKANA